MEFKTMRIASKLPVLALIAALTVLATSAQAQLSFLVINETDSDTPTLPVNDDKEFVELYDGGVGNQSLVGYTIVFYNGGSSVNPCSPGNTSYFAMDLTGSTDANGYYVIGNAGVVPAPAQTFAPNTLQNGADAVALYYGVPAASFPGGTAVTAVNLVDAVAYDTTDFPACALIAVLTPGQPSVNEGVVNSANDSIGRCPNGQGGAGITTGWQANAPSPAAPNNCAFNVYTMSIIQPGGCGGTITVQVVNAAANAELYNLISLACSVPPGSGPLFGLSVGPGSGDPLGEVTLPLGSHPFHVNADITGTYSISFPVSPCPGNLALSVEGVSIQVLPGSYAIQAVTQTTTCINIAI
jgi:hypothetical protein